MRQKVKSEKGKREETKREQKESYVIVLRSQVK
jgi:hypothetical protein